MNPYEHDGSMLVEEGSATIVNQEQPSNEHVVEEVSHDPFLTEAADTIHPGQHQHITQTTLQELQDHLQQATSQNELLRNHIVHLEEEVNNLRETNNQLKVKADLTDIKTDMKTREQVLLKDEEILALKTRIAHLEQEAQQNRLQQGLNVQQAHQLTTAAAASVANINMGGVIAGVDAAAAVAAALDAAAPAAAAPSDTLGITSNVNSTSIDESLFIDEDDDTWNTLFTQLMKYKELHGLNLQYMAQLDPNLAKWTQRQYTIYQKLQEEEQQLQEHQQEVASQPQPQTLAETQEEKQLDNQDIYVKVDETADPAMTTPSADANDQDNTTALESEPIAESDAQSTISPSVSVPETLQTSAVPSPAAAQTQIPTSQLSLDRKIRLEQRKETLDSIGFFQEMNSQARVLAAAAAALNNPNNNGDISVADVEELTRNTPPSNPLHQSQMMGIGSTNHHLPNHHLSNHHLSSLHSNTTTTLGSRSDEKWEQHFQRLVIYYKAHQNCLVPTSTELGRWLCRQRHNHRYKGLKEERRIRLMELDSTCLGETIISSMVESDQQGAGGDVTNAGGDDGAIVNEGSLQFKTAVTPVKTKYNRAYESKLHQKWDQYFQQLTAYKEKHGHANFPTMNGSLGRWISRQRTLYRSKKLKKDRYDKLKDLGFAFEDATALEFKSKLDEQWDNMFNNLVEHKNKNGHCFNVPETLPLGKWLYRQRWLYRHGNLREDRAEKLLGIGFEEKKVLKASSKKRKKRDMENNDLKLGAEEVEAEGPKRQNISEEAQESTKTENEKIVEGISAETESKRQKNNENGECEKDINESKIIRDEMERVEPEQTEISKKQEQQTDEETNLYCNETEVMV